MRCVRKKLDRKACVLNRDKARREKRSKGEPKDVS